MNIHKVFLAHIFLILFSCLVGCSMFRDHNLGSSKNHVVPIFDAVESMRGQFGLCLPDSSLNSEDAIFIPATYKQLLSWFNDRNNQGVFSPLYKKFDRMIKDRINKSNVLPDKQMLLYVQLGNVYFDNPNYRYEVFWDYNGAFVLSYFPKNKDSSIFLASTAYCSLE